MSSTGRAPFSPCSAEGAFLSFLLASSAALICQSAQAQVTTGGGQTVEITNNRQPATPRSVSWPVTKARSSTPMRIRPST